MDWFKCKSCKRQYTPHIRMTLLIAGKQQEFSRLCPDCMSAEMKKMKDQGADHVKTERISDDKI